MGVSVSAPARCADVGRRPSPPSSLLTLRLLTSSFLYSLDKNSTVVLADYLALPPTHYTLLALPLGATLTRVEESERLFALTIPAVTLFTLTVKPTITVSVDVAAPPAPPNVLIEVLDARVDGAWSDQLGLNERFEIYGTTVIKLGGPDGESIDSLTDLRVGVDPPPPFSLLPIGLLTRVGNAVLNGVCGTLQRVFVRALARDAEAFAADPAARAAAGATASQPDLV